MALHSASSSALAIRAVQLRADPGLARARLVGVPLVRALAGAVGDAVVATHDQGATALDIVDYMYLPQWLRLRAGESARSQATGPGRPRARCQGFAFPSRHHCTAAGRLLLAAAHVRGEVGRGIDRHQVLSSSWTASDQGDQLSRAD